MTKTYNFYFIEIIGVVCTYKNKKNSRLDIISKPSFVYSFENNPKLRKNTELNIIIYFLSNNLRFLLNSDENAINEFIICRM